MDAFVPLNTQVKMTPQHQQPPRRRPARLMAVLISISFVALFAALAWNPIDEARAQRPQKKKQRNKRIYEVDAESKKKICPDIALVHSSVVRI